MLMSWVMELQRDRTKKSWSTTDNCNGNGPVATINFRAQKSADTIQ